MKQQFEIPTHGACGNQLYQLNFVRENQNWILTQIFWCSKCQTIVRIGLKQEDLK